MTSDSNEPSVDEWVTVRTCVWGHEADLLRSVLEGSGIEVFIPDEWMGTLRSHVLLATGGVRVQVRASDAQRATALLDEFEKGTEETPN
ncbi:MAG TPA: DUF2007 domain-containing protein [Vicinamibacterales bacterium]